MTKVGGGTGAIFIDDQINLLGPGRFYSDTFINCGMKLEPGANPLHGCTFDPPFESPEWDFLRSYGNVVVRRPWKAAEPAAPLETDLPTGPYIAACKVWGAAVKRRTDRVILPLRWWRDPPPRYRRTRLQAVSRKHRPMTSAAPRAGRERGHAVGHSPRRRSKH